MYGGDEVNALVIDTGSFTVKAGYAGEDTPKAVFPSAVGVLPRQDAAGAANGSKDGAEGENAAKRDLFVGNQAINYRRDHMEVVPALQHGLYSDWELIEALWDHTFSERLRVNPKEHPMMFAEPSFNTKELREKLVETVFEKYSPPALFLAKNAVLSAFATGRQTALVVDMGHEGTVVSAVHDGYVLQKSIARAPLGGRVLSECMLAALDAKNIAVHPRYSFRRKESAPGSGQFEVAMLDVPSTADSYRRYQLEQIGADIKESICRVSDAPFDAEEHANIPTVTYELPDGTEIQIGPDRFKVPEVLFQPKLLATYPGLDAVKGYDGGPLLGLPELVVDSINRCDVDIRRELFNGIILTGGSSAFTALRDRLERELSEVAPQTSKVKVTSPANSLERRFSVWLGGSILASLGSFQQMWMSKEEYEEHGANLIHRKAP